MAVISLGSSLILLIAEVDMSAGPLSGVAGAITALVVNRSVPSVLAILIGLAVAVAVGFLTGVLATRVGVPSFVITLGTQLAAVGTLLLLLGDGGSVLVRDPLIVAIANARLPFWVGFVLLFLLAAASLASTLRRQQRRASVELDPLPTYRIWAAPVTILVLGALVAFALDSVGGIPVLGLILLCVTLLIHWLTTRTEWGRHLYAVGGNAEAARRAGINVKWLKTQVFMLAAALSGLGGVLYLSRSSSVTTASGGGDLTLNSIAGAVIGGVSMFGGRGKTWQALLGTVVIGAALNGMDLLSVSSGIRNIVIGAILVVAVVIDALARHGRVSSGRT
jgi:ABC-type xylose transport system permease subunit